LVSWWLMRWLVSASAVATASAAHAASWRGSRPGTHRPPRPRPAQPQRPGQPAPRPEPGTSRSRRHLERADGPVPVDRLGFALLREVLAEPDRPLFTPRGLQPVQRVE